MSGLREGDRGETEAAVKEATDSSTTDRQTHSRQATDGSSLTYHEPETARRECESVGL